MRIRTQLILATFFLAVVPLAAIVTYSYRSSQRALERAERRETERLTQQMDRRLASIRADLDERISLVSALPVADAATGDAIDTSIAAAMGDATNIVESLEFKPIVPAPQPEPKPEPKPKTDKKVIIVGGEDAKTVVAAEAKADFEEAAAAPVVAPPVAPGMPMMIDLPSAPMMPQYALSEKQRELLDEVGHLGGELGNPKLSPDEREDLRKELATAQRKLHEVIVADSRRYRDQMREARRAVNAVPAPAAAPAQTPVLGAAEDRDEIPFAIDREGTVYTRNAEHRQMLESTGIAKRVRAGESVRGIPGWIVSTTTDNQSGMRIGVARPVGETMEELKRTAARNFGLGLGLIAFALIGIVPLSNHLTRDVKVVIEGAERIADGDLMTRVPVKTKNELGQLARAFNQMAEDLSMQQQMIVEQEVQQRMMSVEFQRKTVELEDARRFQLSMLPKQVPQHEQYDIAVYTRTATEVGGDYYDFHVDDDATLSITIGDATGHGAKAGTMVTVIKTLFAGYESTTPPSAFLGDAAEKIKRMELGRMSMALSLGRIEGHRLTLSSAGMPMSFDASERE